MLQVVSLRNKYGVYITTHFINISMSSTVPYDKTQTITTLAQSDYPTKCVLLQQLTAVVSVAIVGRRIQAHIMHQYHRSLYRRPVPSGAAGASTAGGGSFDTIRSCHIMPTHT